VSSAIAVSVAATVPAAAARTVLSQSPASTSAPTTAITEPSSPVSGTRAETQMPQRSLDGPSTNSRPVRKDSRSSSEASGKTCPGGDDSPDSGDSLSAKKKTSSPAGPPGSPEAAGRMPMT